MVHFRFRKTHRNGCAYTRGNKNTTDGVDDINSSHTLRVRSRAVALGGHRSQIAYKDCARQTSARDRIQIERPTTLCKFFSKNCSNLGAISPHWGKI